MISPENIDKLQKLGELANSIPCNAGENFVSLRFGSGQFSYGAVIFMLDWKSDCGESEFMNLDEAIAIVEKIKQKVSAE